MFTEAADGLRYREHLGAPLRCFVGVLAVAMWMIPVPFVVHLNASAPWPMWLVAGAAVLAASAMGTLFTAIALGRPLQLWFCPARGCLLRTSRWPWQARDVPIAFDRITLHEPLRKSSEDGDYFVLSVQVDTERPMQLGVWDALEQARHWHTRLELCLQAPAHRP